MATVVSYSGTNIYFISRVGEDAYFPPDTTLCFITLVKCWFNPTDSFGLYLKSDVLGTSKIFAVAHTEKEILGVDTAENTSNTSVLVSFNSIFSKVVFI